MWCGNASVQTRVFTSAMKPAKLTRASLVTERLLIMLSHWPHFYVIPVLIGPSKILWSSLLVMLSYFAGPIRKEMTSFLANEMAKSKGYFGDAWFDLVLKGFYKATISLHNRCQLPGHEVVYPLLLRQSPYHRMPCSESFVFRRNNGWQLRYFAWKNEVFRFLGEDVRVIFMVNFSPAIPELW